MSGSSVDADVPTVLRILWGQADGRHDGAHAARAGGPRYAMLPRAETAKALVPSWPPAVTAAVVRNYITPRTRSERRRASILELAARLGVFSIWRSEEHTSELQSRGHLVCRLLLEKKN